MADYTLTATSETISATEGDICVSITGDSGGRNTIITGAGNDSILVDPNRDESLEKRYRNYINAGDGNNYIDNRGVDRSTVLTGTGDDTILTSGGDDTYTWIGAGAGDNKISVNTAMSYGRIYAEGGNDFVSVAGSGSQNIISVGGGDDSVIAGTSNSTINMGAGKNFLTLNAGSSSNNIIAGSGDDSILINGSYNNVSLGSGNNILKGGWETVTAGDGADSITVSGGYVNVGGGSNNVSITYGDYTTIIAGDDDDTINVADIEDETSTAEQRTRNNINAGGGNNYIYNSNVERSTIRAGSGNDTIITGGGNNSINVGAGDNQISVKTAMNGGTIYAGDGNDLVSVVSGSQNIISVGGGDDSIINGASNSTINVGVGKNFVSLSGSSNSVIAGNSNDYVSLASSASGNNISLGGGSNSVEGTGGNNYIYSGDDDDFITVGGGYVGAGGGNNNVSLANGNSQIVLGDGNDTINVADTDETADKRYYNNINAGGGDNYIYNSNVERSTIRAGSGDDTIITGGGNTSINAGEGDNQISVKTAMASGRIYAGDGNDTVSVVSGSQNIISVGGGDDSIINGASNSTINVGIGKNFLSLSGSGNSVIAGNDDDFVIASGNSTLSLGGGNNTVQSTNYRQTIYAGAGNDLITVSNGYLDLGDGTNNISITYGGSTTIYSGAGDDSINVAETEATADKRTMHIINAGDGDNYINDSNVELSTISAGSGNDTIITGGGVGNNTYQSGYGYLYPSILAGAGDNQIFVNSNMTYGRIYAGGGNDLVSIDGDGSNNIISVGDGRNTIITANHYDYTYNDENTIEAGNGSDLIYTIARDSFINAGSGRNYISLGGGAGNTIVTGKGNDTITFGADSNNNVIIFGEGNDLVLNYHAGDTVRAASSITQKIEANDIIISDGSSYMTLRGAASLRSARTATLSSDNNVYKILAADKTIGDSVLPDGISSTPADTTPASKSVTLSDSDNYYYNSVEGATINALAGNDTISNVGAKVSISGGAGDDSINLNDGADISINGGAGADSVYLSGAVTGFKFEDFGAGDVIILNSTVNSLNTISGGVVAGNVTITGLTAQTSGNAWSFDDNVATYTTKNSAGAALSSDKKSVIYNAASDKTLLTISGVTSTDGLAISGNVVTVSANSLNKQTVRISDGYTLTLASDVAAPSTKNAAWNISGGIATYKAAETVAGYSLDDNEIIYTPADGGETLTVSGVTSTGGLAISGNYVTVSANSLNKQTVRISDGYTLRLANGVDNPYYTRGDWNISGGIATYKAAETVAGYSVYDNEIIYTPASGGDTVTVSGVTSTSGLAIDGKVVTVSAYSLNEQTVRISDGYTLQLASDVTTTINSSADWTLNGNTASYITSTITAGYELKDNQINYTTTSGGDTVTVSGVKALDGLAIDGKVVTVSAYSLNEENVTISDGYTLRLASDVTTTTNSSAYWTLNGNTASYVSTTITTGYELKDNQINYTTTSKADTPVEVSGVKSLDGLNLSGNYVTVGAAALNNQNVSITGGYYLELDDDVTTSYTTAAGWTVDYYSHNAIYRDASTTAGYKLNNNQISYVEASGGATLAELSGVAYYYNPTVDSGTIFIAADNFYDDEISVVNGGGFAFELVAGDYYDKIFSGNTFNDNIINNGENVTFRYSAGGGNDTITGFNADDTLNIAGASYTSAQIGNDLILTVGEGSVVLKDAANLSTINISGTLSGGGSDTTPADTTPADTTALIIDNKNGSSATIGADMEIADASTRTKPIKIIGNARDNSIIGGSGNDTLDGADGDNNLTGGKGNDVFVYSGGKGFINDYSQKGAGGADKINIASNLTYNDYEIEGGNVILNYGDGNDLTIIDGAEKEITFTGGKKATNIYTAEGVLDGKKKSMTLSADVKHIFNAAKYSKLVTIDGAATGDIQIVGNKKGNYIIAGNNDATLNGGKGNDTLRGGDGEDLFLYANKSGKDVILNYGGDDRVSLGSGAEIKDAYVKSKNAVIKIGSGSITVKNTSEVKLLQDGAEILFKGGLLIDEGKSTAKVYSSFKGTIDLDEYDLTTADATLAKKSVTLQGGSSSDSLLGGNGKDSLIGGDEDDTLNGGKGNDTLWGGTGNDTFIYQANSGNDVIADYQSGELLTILDKRGKDGDFKDSAFSDGTLTLTINGGGKVSFRNVDTSTAFNINGTTYSVRNGKLNK